MPTRSSSLEAADLSRRDFLGGLALGSVTAGTLAAATPMPAAAGEVDEADVVAPSDGSSYVPVRRPPSWRDASPLDWMKGLYDNVPITDVNIPGTHDTGCYNMPFGCGEMTKTQTLNVPHQLETGIRLLDIRLRAWNDTELALCHEYKYCTCYLYEEGEAWTSLTRLKFSHVLKACEDFLKAHPTEFVVIIPTHETGDKDDYLKLFKKHIDDWAKKTSPNGGPLLYTGHAVPTVGEARGRIILINELDGTWREDAERDDGIAYKSSFNHVGTTRTPDTLAGHKEGCAHGEYKPITTYLSSRCKVKKDEKLENKWVSDLVSFTHWAEKLPEAGSGTYRRPASWRELVMTAVSGYYQDTTFPYPMLVAEATAPFARDYPFQKGYRYGWVSFDFVTYPGKADRISVSPDIIYNTNWFKGERQQTLTRGYVDKVFMATGKTMQEAVEKLFKAEVGEGCTPHDHGYMVIPGACCNLIPPEIKKKECAVLGYTLTDRPEDALRGLVFTDSSLGADLTIDGIAYNAVRKVEPGTYSDATRDLAGFGVSGKYYLHQSWDHSCGAPITDIGSFFHRFGVDDLEGELTECGWQAVLFENNPLDIIPYGNLSKHYLRYIREGERALGAFAAPVSGEGSEPMTREDYEFDAESVIPIVQDTPEHESGELADPGDLFAAIDAPDFDALVAAQSADEAGTAQAASNGIGAKAAGLPMPAIAGAAAAVAALVGGGIYWYEKRRKENEKAAAADAASQNEAPMQGEEPSEE